VSFWEGHMKGFSSWLRVMGVGLALVATLLAQPPQDKTGRSQGPEFVPLRQPYFVPAAQANFLKDTDRVVGVSENGVSKAYEPDVTAWHHVVEDRLGELPVIVTWCSLCNTPLVYRSEVGGRKLTFERAGNRGNNFYMSDSETGSHWQQISGECFEGPMKGKRLTMVPFLLTTWGEWRGLHPQTVVLVPEEKYHDQYAAMAKRIATIAYGSNKSPDRELIRQQDTRLPNYEQVIGIEAGGAHKAYPVAALHKEPLLNDKVGARPVVLIYAANTDTTTAFSRVAGGRTLTFKPTTPGLIVDDETGSTWTAYGECTAGKFKGQRLERIVPQPGLWFAWAEFNPDTEVYSGAIH
jgi:Protein of unknown function (DUF3179)